MLICKADTKPVEHILFLEPRQSEAITNNPVYVAAVTKYYLHYTLKTTLEFLSRADETLECQNERTTDEVKHLRFALLHRKVKRTVANYIDDYRHSNNLSEDEHDVVSSFLEFLMNFWNIENFMMEIDVACPAFKRHQKENTTKQYCEDTYYICLTVYMSHEIDNKYEKEQVKLMIWRKLARQMYLDALYPWFKAKYLKCLAGKELHLKHHSPIECKKSDNFYNNIIDFLNRISNSKNNPIDFDRGPAVAFDIGPYLIGYFVDNTLEINLGENFMHKKDIVADLLSYLRVEDRYKETIQRLSKKCDKILWFHIFNYESDVAAALSFTAINNDRIQLCKYQTAVISLISDSYIHNLSNTFLIEFKKNRALARGVISKSSYSIRNIFRHDKGTETLFSAIKLTNDLIVRIIHNGVDPYKTLQTKIYDEIKNLLYFCVRNQQTTQIDKLNRICGFEPEVKNDVDQNSQVKKHKQAHSGAQTDFRCKYNQKTLKELEGERLCQNKSKNIYVKADSSKIQRSTHTKSLAKTFEKEDQHGQTIPEIFDHQAQAEESKSEGLPTESHSRDNEPENCCNQYETKEDLEPDEALAIRLSSQNQNKKSKVMDEDTDIERPSKHELKLPKDIKNMPDNVHNLSGTAKVKLPETNDKFKLATEIYQQCEMTEQKQLVNFEEEIGKNHCNSMINSHIQESADQNQYDGDLTHIGKNNSISVDTVARDFSQHNESFVMNKKNCQEANTHNREHLQNYPKDTRHTHNDDLVSQQSANFINVKSGTFGMTATEIISDTKTSKISVDQSKLLSPDPCVDTLETKKQIVTKSDESKAKNTQSFTVGRNGKSKHKIPDTLTSTSMMSHETCIGQVAEHEVSKPLPEGHNDNKHFDTKTGKANASSWNCQRNKARAALQIGPGRQTLAPRFQRSLYFRPRDSQCKQSSKPSTNAQLTASDPQTPSIPETNPSIYHDAANQQNINLAQNKSIDNGQNQIASSRQTEVAVSVETSSQQTPSLQKTMQRENSNPISQDLVNDGNCIERENAKFRNHCRLVYATHDYGHMSRNSEVLVRFSTLHLNNIPYTDGIDE